MLVLFETSGGYAIFKVLKEKKLQKPENLYKEFKNPETASKLIKLKHFQKFESMEEALESASCTVKGKMSKKLKKVLKSLSISDAQEELAVADAKLGGVINSKLNISCINNTSINELNRCIRVHLNELLEDIPEKDITAMTLGVSHGLSRYKFKFSPDKIDKMIIEAISALDDLDKELNNYIMRCKEWYGWHFPELSKVISNNRLYIKTVLAIGFRENASKVDLSDFLSEDDEAKVKGIAEISMGTDITDDDLKNITNLCKEVLEMQQCRTKLHEYLKNRMAAIAPNVTALVGEMIGARLMSHAGSLVKFAKHPASTVQILGAEKALFRALKARHETPKYGLIYHAQLIGQSKTSLKAKMSRMLAAKTALSARVDAFAEDEIDIGMDHRAKLEKTLQALEQGQSHRISGTGKYKARHNKYENESKTYRYKASSDSTFSRGPVKREFVSRDARDDMPCKKIKSEIKKKE